MHARLFWPSLLALSLATGCSRSRPAKTPEVPQVVVAHPRETPVPDFIDLTGTVSASKTVDLVARVSGYLRSADFEEGAQVEAGQLLFVIEPEPYEQQLLLAEAALTRAKAEYERQLGLQKEDATAVATVERWKSERDQAAAQVEIARLNLGYTKVVAPFSGRIGRRLVDPGNLVGPTSNTRLATLEQTAPVYINFNLNERDALRIHQLMREHDMGSKPRPGQVPVLLGLQNQDGFPYEGALDFIDTGLDTSSGTIQLRASLPNGKEGLIPGLFTRVRLPLGRPQPMLVIPGEALGNDQEGDYVLLVDSSDTVVRRAVVKGPLTAGGWGIRTGLARGDRVMVKGQMKARPGTKVKAVPEAESGPADRRVTRPD